MTRAVVIGTQIPEYYARPLWELWAVYEREKNNRGKFMSGLWAGVFRAISARGVLGRVLWTPGHGLGRPLKKCIFQTRPQNLYNQTAQVESFNLVPISSKMVEIMMVYERPAKWHFWGPFFIVKMSVSGIRIMRGPMVFTKTLCAARWFLSFIMRDCSLVSFCHKLSLVTIWLLWLIKAVSTTSSQNKTGNVLTLSDKCAEKSSKGV